MEFNQTLFIQAGIFIAILFILKTLYFEPILELLRRRAAATTGRVEEADQMIAQMEAMKRDYNDRLYRVRSELEKNRETQLASLRDELTQDLERLKAKMDEGAKTHLEILDREVKTAHGRFPALAQELKKEMIESITTLKWGRV